jgi:hypothetical protein
MSEIESIPNNIKINLIKDLITMPGWAILVDYLNYNISVLDSKINTVDPTQNTVCYTQKDLTILDKQNIQELIKSPERLIENLREVNNGVTIDEALKDNDLINLSSAMGTTGLI